MPATRTLLTLAALGTVVLAGCKNPVDIRQQIVYDVQSANYALAVPKVNDLYDCALTGDLAAPGDAKLVDKDDIDEKEELLWRMERGAIDLLRTDPPSALRHLDRASQLVVERRTESLTRAVGTYLANDTASEYAGNGYEHVQVDFQRALANVLAAQQQQGIMAKTGAETAELDTAVQAMNNIARGMVLEKIQFNQDNAPDLRYFDAPFARIFAAAVYLATPLDQRSRDDEGFAMAQVTKALKAYVEQKKVLGGDGYFRYEVDGIPPAVLRLAALIGRSYDAEGFNTLLGQVGIAANDPRLGAPLAKDQGLVLLLNQADWITPTDVLTIDLKVNVPYVPSISEAERARGVTVTGFMTFGGTTFYAKGPNSRAAESWGGAIATLGEVAKFFGVAAPGTWIGFEMPTHRARRAGGRRDGAAGCGHHRPRRLCPRHPQGPPAVGAGQDPDPGLRQAHRRRDRRHRRPRGDQGQERRRTGLRPAAGHRRPRRRQRQRKRRYPALGPALRPHRGLPGHGHRRQASDLGAQPGRLGPGR